MVIGDSGKNSAVRCSTCSMYNFCTLWVVKVGRKHYRSTVSIEESKPNSNSDEVFLGYLGWVPMIS